MAPIILGAGPAGCAAAITLAQSGHPPMLIDRDAEALDPLCGGFLSWRTAAQLAALGAEPATLGACRVERVVLHARDREAAVALPAPAFGVSRHALDNALRQRAVALGARLEVDNARGIEGTAVLGRERHWQADGLILATGKHDVRGQARPRRSADPALGLRLRLPSSPARSAMLEGRIELHLFAGGYAGIVLQEDDLANVCLAIRKSVLGQAGGDPVSMLEALCSGYPAFAARLGADWREESIETVGAVPYGWIAQDTEPGLFRVGDQAAVIPSLAGEGIGIALASGVMAARAWLEHGSAGAPGFQHRLAALAQRPVGIARLARSAAESRWAAPLAVALAARAPGAVRWLMDASRFAPAGQLAHSPSAP